MSALEKIVTLLAPKRYRIVQPPVNLKPYSEAITVTSGVTKFCHDRDVFGGCALVKGCAIYEWDCRIVLVCS